MIDSNEKLKKRKKMLFPARIDKKVLNNLTTGTSDRLQNLAESLLTRLLSDLRPLLKLYALLDKVFEGDVASSRTYIRLFKSLDVSLKAASPDQQPDLIKQRINNITPHPKLKTFLVNPINIGAIVLGAQVASWTCQAPKLVDLWRPISGLVRQLDYLQDIHDLATRKKYAQLEALLVSISKENAILDRHKETKAPNAVDEWQYICYKESNNLLSLSAAIVQFRPDVVHSDGIESLDPVVGCSGDLLRIIGRGFDNLRPGPDNRNQRVTLRVGGRYVPMEEKLWSDTEIQVELPENIQTSNVGFVDLFFLQMYARMQGLMSKYLEKSDFPFEIPCDPLRITHIANYTIAYGAPSTFYSVLLGGEYLPIPEPPSNGNNHLQAGRPIIDAFHINEAESATIQSAKPVILEWFVVNAKSIKVQRISSHGPDIDLHELDPDYQHYHQHDLGPTGLTDPHTIRYRLIAESYCGGSEVAEVAALISVPAQVAITGCEFTQAIQHYGRTGKTDNSVPLIANKDTVIRLYTESLTGATRTGVSADLSFRNNNGAWSGWLAARNNPIDVLQPGAINRVQTDHTFNFLIPSRSADAGSLEVRFRLNTPSGVQTQTTNDEYPDPYDLIFLHPIPPLNIFRVRYNWSGNTPSEDDFNVRARSVRAMSPVADIVFWEPIAAHQIIRTPHALNTDDGLEAALADLDAVADEYVDNGEYWIAMSTDPNRGISYIDGRRHICYVGDPTDPADWLFARTKATHELGHSLGLYHINIGGAPDDWDHHDDAGLVLDIPFDSENMIVPVDTFDMSTPLDPSINRGIADVMGYSIKWIEANPTPPPVIRERRSPRWTSAQTWTRYYGQTLIPSAKGNKQGGAMHSGVNLYRFCGMLYADRRFTWIPGYPSIRTRGYQAPSEESTFGVRLLDVNGRTLIDYPITVTWGNLGQDPALAYIKQFIPWNDKMVRMEFYEKDSIIFAVDRTSQRLSIELMRDVEALVRDAGKKKIRVSWTVDSTDKSSLEYYLFFSGDNGKSYVPLDIRLKRPEVELRPSDLPGGKQCRLKVVATDGLNVAEMLSKSFVLPIRKPTAEIHWPQNNSEVRRGAKVEVSGQGYFWTKRLQYEGKTEWFVDNQLVSNERSFTLEIPKKGTKVMLKLLVTDDEGQTDEKTYRLKIV